MTYFIKIENGMPQPGIIVEDNIRYVIPALASVRLFTPEMVEPHGFGIFDFSSQPALGRYEKLMEVAPVKNDRGIWMQSWSVVPMTDEERATADTAKTNETKNQRTMFLLMSDWTQLPDAPIAAEKKAEWATYRQALRDIPQQTGFPWDVQWPTKPE